MPNGDRQPTKSNGVIRERYTGYDAATEVQFQFVAVERGASGTWTVIYQVKGNIFIPGDRGFRRLPVDREIRIQTHQVGRKPRKREAVDD